MIAAVIAGYMAVSLILLALRKKVADYLLEFAAFAYGAGLFGIAAWSIITGDGLFLWEAIALALYSSGVLIVHLRTSRNGTNSW